MPRCAAKRCGAPVECGRHCRDHAPIDGECPICLCEIDVAGDACVLKCRHAFHKNCMQTWARDYKMQCPVCRTAIARSHLTAFGIHIPKVLPILCEIETGIFGETSSNYDVEERIHVILHCMEDQFREEIEDRYAVMRFLRKRMSRSPRRIENMQSDIEKLEESIDIIKTFEPEEESDDTVIRVLKTLYKRFDSARAYRTLA